MSVSRRLARQLLAPMFVSGGLEALRHPDSKAAKADKVAPALARRLGLPEDTTTLVRINGAVQVGAGILLVTGRLPRMSATVLALSLVPTTLAGHRFWEEKDPRARAAQRVHFMKNSAMLGGLILAAVDTGGRPSLSWRARRVANRAVAVAAR
jgi:putative oxidoreductase